jgi:hypothetical protein
MIIISENMIGLLGFPIYILHYPNPVIDMSLAVGSKEEKKPS